MRRVSSLSTIRASTSSLYNPTPWSNSPATAPSPISQNVASFSQTANSTKTPSRLQFSFGRGATSAPIKPGFRGVAAVLSDISNECAQRNFDTAMEMIHEAVRRKTISNDYFVSYFNGCARVNSHSQNTVGANLDNGVIVEAILTGYRQFLLLQDNTNKVAFDDNLVNALLTALVPFASLNTIQSVYKSIFAVQYSKSVAFLSSKNSVIVPKRQRREFRKFQRLLNKTPDRDGPADEALASLFSGDFAARMYNPALQKYIYCAPDNVFPPPPLPTIYTLPTHLYKHIITACARTPNEIAEKWYDYTVREGIPVPVELHLAMLSYHARATSAFTGASPSLMYSPSFIALSPSHCIHSPAPAWLPTMPRLPLADLLADLDHHASRAAQVLDRVFDQCVKDAQAADKHGSTDTITPEAAVAALSRVEVPAQALVDYATALCRAIVPPETADAFYGSLQVAEIAGLHAVTARLNMLGHKVSVHAKTGRLHTKVHDFLDVQVEHTPRPAVLGPKVWPFIHCDSALFANGHAEGNTGNLRIARPQHQIVAFSADTLTPPPPTPTEQRWENETPCYKSRHPDIGGREYRVTLSNHMHAVVAGTPTAQARIQAVIMRNKALLTSLLTVVQWLCGRGKAAVSTTTAATATVRGKSCSVYDEPDSAADSPFAAMGQIIPGLSGSSPSTVSQLRAVLIEACLRAGQPTVAASMLPGADASTEEEFDWGAWVAHELAQATVVQSSLDVATTVNIVSAAKEALLASTDPAKEGLEGQADEDDEDMIPTSDAPCSLRTSSDRSERSRSAERLELYKQYDNMPEGPRYVAPPPVLTQPAAFYGPQTVPIADALRPTEEELTRWCGPLAFAPFAARVALRRACAITEDPLFRVPLVDAMTVDTNAMMSVSDVALPTSELDAYAASAALLESDILTQTPQSWPQAGYGAYELLVNYACHHQDIHLALRAHHQLCNSTIDLASTTVVSPPRLAQLCADTALLLMRAPLSRLAHTSSSLDMPATSWSALDPGLTSVLRADPDHSLSSSIKQVEHALEVLADGTYASGDQLVTTPPLVVALGTIAAYSGDVLSVMRLIHFVQESGAMAYIAQWLPSLVTTAYAQAFARRTLQVSGAGSEYAAHLQSVEHAIRSRINAATHATFDPLWQVAISTDNSREEGAHQRNILRASPEGANGALQAHITRMRAQERKRLRQEAEQKRKDDEAEAEKQEMAKVEREKEQSRYAESDAPEDNLKALQEMYKASLATINSSSYNSPISGGMKVEPQAESSVPGMPNAVPVGFEELPVLFDLKLLPRLDEGTLLEAFPQYISPLRNWVRHRSARYASNTVYSKATYYLRNKDTLDNDPLFPPLTGLLLATVYNRRPHVEKFLPQFSGAHLADAELLYCCLNDVVNIHKAAVCHLSHRYGMLAGPMPIAPSLVLVPAPGMPHAPLEPLTWLASCATAKPFEGVRFLRRLLSQLTSHTDIARLPYVPETGMLEPWALQQYTYQGAVGAVAVHQHKHALEANALTYERATRRVLLALAHRYVDAGMYEGARELALRALLGPDAKQLVSHAGANPKDYCPAHDISTIVPARDLVSAAEEGEWAVKPPEAERLNSEIPPPEEQMVEETVAVLSRNVAEATAKADADADKESKSVGRSVSMQPRSTTDGAPSGADEIPEEEVVFTTPVTWLPPTDASTAPVSVHAAVVWLLRVAGIGGYGRWLAAHPLAGTQLQGKDVWGGEGVVEDESAMRVLGRGMASTAEHIARVAYGYVAHYAPAAGDAEGLEQWVPVVVRACADAVSARRAPPVTSVMLALSSAVSALMASRGLREHVGTVQAAVLSRMLVSGAAIPIDDATAVDAVQGIGTGAASGASVSLTARLAMLSGGIVRSAGVGESTYDAHSVMRGGVAACTRAWLREKLNGALSEDERIACVNVMVNVGEIEVELRREELENAGVDVAEAVMGMARERRAERLQREASKAAYEERKREEEARSLYRRYQH